MKNLAKTITANSVYSGGVYINVIPEGVSGKSKRAQKAIKLSPIATKENQMTVQKTDGQIREDNIGADFANRLVNHYNSPDSSGKINIIKGAPGSSKTSCMNFWGIQALVKNGVRLFVLAVPQTTLSDQTYQALERIVERGGVVSKVCDSLKIPCVTRTGETFKTEKPEGGFTSSKVRVVITTVQFVHSNKDLFINGELSPAVTGEKAIIIIDEAHIGVGNTTPENSITNKGHGYGQGKWAGTFKDIMDSSPDLWRIFAMTASPTPSQLGFSIKDKIDPNVFMDMDNDYRDKKDYPAYDLIPIYADESIENEDERLKKVAQDAEDAMYVSHTNTSIKTSTMYNRMTQNAKQWLRDMGNEATAEMPNHFDGYCAPLALLMIGQKNTKRSLSHLEVEESQQTNPLAKNFRHSMTYGSKLYVKDSNGKLCVFKKPYDVMSHLRNDYYTPGVHRTYSMAMVGINVPNTRTFCLTRTPSQDVDSGPLVNNMGRCYRLIRGKAMNSQDFIQKVWSDATLSASEKQDIHDYFLALNVSTYIVPDFRLITGKANVYNPKCNRKPFDSVTAIEQLREISYSKEEFYAEADKWKAEALDKLHIGTYLARAKNTKGVLCEHCAIVEYQGEQMPGCLANHLNTEQVSVQEALESYQQELRDEYVKSVLSVHHNDVDPTNNSEENLTTLCHNAHMTITHRGNHTGVRHTENRKTAVFGSSITTLKKINKAAKKQLRSVK